MKTVSRSIGAWCVVPLFFVLVANCSLRAADSTPPTTAPSITIHVDQIKGTSSPMLYGLMTEEINYSYEGGIYGELIRNRTFKADAKNPVFWNAVGDASISLDPTAPLNDALNVSLKLVASKATEASPAGITNGGYWGIPIQPNTPYHVSFFAKAENDSVGPLTVALTSADGKTTFASARTAQLTTAFKQYELTLTTPNGIAPSKDNLFTITTTSPGTVWFAQVSLFPPTMNDRPNGNRADLLQLMAALQPKFLRMPGGNYLEGNTIAERFDWKKTIGDVLQRPGHESPWGYWSTDGFGLMEFLHWCEDLHMEPILAVYAGYSLRGEKIAAGADLQPFVQDALDEIEYVTGDASTKWGAQRAKDGHPAPFPMHYVEIGNEDFAERNSTYDARFTQFYDAIKAKYPQLQCISTVANDQPQSKRVHSRSPDLLDEHLYPGTEMAMEARAHEFDNLPRTGPKIFVGEWATRAGSPTTNMEAALGDAAWMTGMERNSDLVILQSYAPLLVNVSDLHKGGSIQWRSDLIGYDALGAYGSPSYYAQLIFNTHHGDQILATSDANVGKRTWQPPAGKGGQRRAAVELPTLFESATRDSTKGLIYLKVVNPLATPQTVHINIEGGSTVDSDGESVTLTADSLAATNSIAEPKKVTPTTSKETGLGNSFDRTLAPFSINVYTIKAR